MKKIIIVLFSLAAISCEPEPEFYNQFNVGYYTEKRCIVENTKTDYYYDPALKQMQPMFTSECDSFTTDTFAVQTY